MEVEASRRRCRPIPMRQIVASLIAGSFSIVCGSSLAYAGIAVPQILDRENGTSFNVSSGEILWISSSTSLAIPLGVALSGLSMDAWGRLVTLKLSIVPNVIGWILIATAQSGFVLVLGRIFTGISFALASGPSFVYISEMSDPNFRGALLCFPGIFFSVGILLTYFKGWLIHWRLVSWIYLVYAVLSVGMTMFLPETPSWLASKGRRSEARRSLEWFGIEPKKEELVELDEQSAQRERITPRVDFRIFLHPTCYKPFVIVSLLFALQQFTGLYVITLNSVIFFKDVGVAMDPYQASVYMGVLRLVVCLIGAWITNKIGRRILIMASAGGMGCCMVLSGLFTQWIQEGTNTQTWVPFTVALVYFAFAAIGLQILPFAIASEVFPQSVRGIMQGLTFAICYLLMFASLHSYNWLKEFCGGPAGLQYFFASLCLVTILFVYLFLPETFRKTLGQIEEFFFHKVLYI